MSTTTDRLIAGATPHATVTHFPFRYGQHKDDTCEYTGAIVEENDDWIVINVWGSNMTFSKDRCLISKFHRA